GLAGGKAGGKQIGSLFQGTPGKDSRSLFCHFRTRRRNLGPEKLWPIQVDVEVPVRRGFYPADARDGTERRGDFLRDGARGLPQRARQLEGCGRRQVAELTLGGILEGE